MMFSENDIMVCTMAYFSLLPPARLLSSLVLSVFCLANRSFVPFSLHCYYNMIWQCFCNLKQPPVQGAGAEKTQRQRRRRRRRGKRMRKRKWEKEEGKPDNPDTARTRSIKTNISAEAGLVFYPPSSLTWLAGGEIDACVSSWKRTHRRHLIHGLHLSAAGTNRRGLLRFLSFTTTISTSTSSCLTLLACFRFRGTKADTCDTSVLLTANATKWERCDRDK